MDNTMTKTKGQMYHWVIVLGCMFLFAAQGALVQNAQQAFALDITNEFGITITQFNFMITIMNLVAVGSHIVYSIILGKQINHRAMMLVCAIGVSVGMFCYSFATNITMFYVLGAIVSLLTGGIGANLTTIITTRWFQDKRGLALGLVSTGSSIGAALIVPIMTVVSSATSWQMGYRILALIIFLGSVPFILFVLRMTPQEKDRLPYLDKKTKEAQTAAPVDMSAMLKMGVPRARSLKSVTFWAQALAVAFLGIVFLGVSFNTIPYLNSIGFTPEEGALVVSVTALSGMAAKVIMGYIVDKLTPVSMALVFGVFGVVGIGCFFLTSSIPALVWVGAIGAGFYGAQGSVSVGVLLPKYFGLAGFPSLMPLTMMAIQLGFATGPSVTSIISDNFGYSAAWLALLVIVILSTVAGILAFNASKKLEMVDMSV